jgi:hypothetical protein
MNRQEELLVKAVDQHLTTTGDTDSGIMSCIMSCDNIEKMATIRCIIDHRRCVNGSTLDYTG